MKIIHVNVNGIMAKNTRSYNSSKKKNQMSSQSQKHISKTKQNLKSRVMNELAKILNAQQEEAEE